MKLLHEIVQEEITRLYPLPATKATEDGKIVPDLVEMALKADENKHSAIKRLQEDKALTILTSLMSQILSTAAAMPIPPEGKREAYTQLIVETITIWENAHNAFNNQLKPKQ